VFTFALVNMLLGVFNLLPIPPLDGSALLERVLPARWLPGWYRFRPYGLLVLLVLIFWTGAISKVLDPVIDELFKWVFR
jgi:Zn-dependent protease